VLPRLLLLLLLLLPPAPPRLLCVGWWRVRGLVWYHTKLYVAVGPAPRLHAMLGGREQHALVSRYRWWRDVWCCDWLVFAWGL
jgi:hypothetical protein